MVTHAEMTGEAPAKPPELLTPGRVPHDLMTRPMGGMKITQEMMDPNWQQGSAFQNPVPMKEWAPPESLFNYKDAVQVADLLLGLPAFIYGTAQTGMLSGVAAAQGSKEPLKEGAAAYEHMVQGDNAWGRFLRDAHAPIQSQMELAGHPLETEGTAVGGGLEQLNSWIDTAADYWSEKTGEPEVGELLKQMTNVGMLLTGTVAKGVKGHRGKVDARKLAKAQKLMKEQADAARTEFFANNDPFFERWAKPDPWFTEEGFKTHVDSFKADPKVKEKIAGFLDKPKGYMEAQGKELVKWVDSQRRADAVPEFPELSASVDKILRKDPSELNGGERALLQHYNEGLAAKAVKQGGFMTPESAPWIFAALGSGSIAAMYGLAQYFKDAETMETLGPLIQLGILVPVARNHPSVKKFKRLKKGYEAEGLTREGMRDRLWKDTGVGKMPDGTYMREISDAGAKLKNMKKHKFPGREHLVNPAPPRKFLEEPRTLGDIMDHPELYGAEPGAADITIGSTGFDFGSRGSYSKSKNQMRLASGTPEDVLDTILHETQHYVQGKYDLNRGGNVAEFLPKDYDARVDKTKEDLKAVEEQINEVAGEVPNSYSLATMMEHADTIKVPVIEMLQEAAKGKKSAMLLPSEQKAAQILLQAGGRTVLNYLRLLREKVELADMRNEAHLKYGRLGGEVQARLASFRKDMSKADRRAIPPWRHYDVPEADWDIRRGDPERDCPSPALA